MFGERLKNVLQDNDISQLKLAQELGYTQQAVNRWCNNITEPDNKTIVAIAKYLNISTDYLLGNDNDLNENEEELREINNLMKMARNNKDFLKENK